MTWGESMNIQELVAFFKKACAYDQMMGLEFEIPRPGEAVYKLTIASKHCSSPESCHGGVISGMMDGTIGLAALGHAVTVGMFCSTVEIKTNFLRPARVGDVLIGRGKVDYTGKAIVVSSGSIERESDGQLIAKAMGTFNLYPIHKKNLGELNYGDEQV